MKPGEGMCDNCGKQAIEILLIGGVDLATRWEFSLCRECKERVAHLEDLPRTERLEGAFGSDMTREQLLKVLRNSK